MSKKTEKVTKLVIVVLAAAVLLALLLFATKVDHASPFGCDCEYCSNDGWYEPKEYEGWRD